MKIIHFSDTHLWLSLENTTREDDFYNNFTKVIDEIIKSKPDVVIHSGDLFHTPKPSNKAISVVVKNFLKLENAWINVIIIAWNHDTPRLSTTTHSFEIFDEFKNFYVFYKPEIVNLEIWWVNFVSLAHIHDEILFKQEFLKAKELIKKDLKNIFISHFGISAKEYEEYTDEISWVNITLEELSILKQFDYVALWHYHKNFCIWNICYPWSLEHTSFNQKDYKVWFNEIILWEKTQINKNYISTRSMIDFWEFDCKDFKSTTDLIESLEKNINNDTIKGSIVKITFFNINEELLLDFNDKEIYNFFKDCFYFEFKKIKFTNENNSFFQINNSKNLIYDNFWDFINKKEIQDTKLKQKLVIELQNELKNIS